MKHERIGERERVCVELTRWDDSGQVIKIALKEWPGETVATTLTEAQLRQLRDACDERLADLD